MTSAARELEPHRRHQLGRTAATSRSQRNRHSRGERIRTSHAGPPLGEANSDFARSQVVTRSLAPGSSPLVPAFLVFLGNGCLPIIARGSPRVPWVRGASHRPGSPSSCGVREGRPARTSSTGISSPLAGDPAQASISRASGCSPMGHSRLTGCDDHVSPTRWLGGQRPRAPPAQGGARRGSTPGA